MIDHVEDTGAELGKLRIDHRRRIVRSAGDHPLVPQARDPRQPSVGHDRDDPDRHGRGAAGQLGFDERGRAGRLICRARAGRCSASSFESSTTTARSFRATGRARAICRRAAPAVVRRYFKKDEDCVDEDNWFDTGDIAVIHPDNTLRLTDRAKDVIKSGRRVDQLDRARECGGGLPRRRSRPRRSASRIPSGTSGRCC